MTFPALAHNFIDTHTKKTKSVSERDWQRDKHEWQSLIELNGNQFQSVRFIFQQFLNTFPKILNINYIKDCFELWSMQTLLGESNN